MPSVIGIRERFQFDRLRLALIVPHRDGEKDGVRVIASLADRVTEQLEDVPQSARFVLAFHPVRDTDVLAPQGRGDGHRAAEAGLLCDRRHIDQYPVLDGLPASVGVDQVGTFKQR